MKRTKKEITVYRRAALAVLRVCGAQLADHHYAYQLDTTAGLLRLSIDDGCVCTRFEDVEQAKAQLPHRLMHDRLNPCSGKWNWMGGHTHDEDIADLAHFQHELRRLLPAGHQPNPDLPLVPYEG
ncbi:hypothetical protein D3C84_725050 [compost metagenome]